MMKPLDDQALDALLADAAAPVPQGFAPAVMQRWHQMKAGQAPADESLALPALEAMGPLAEPTASERSVIGTPQGLRTWLRAAVMAGGGVLAFSELMALVFGLWQAGQAL